MVRFARAASLALLMLLPPTAAWAQQKVVNVYNWSDYIAKDTVERFEAATGIKVNYDVFDDNAVLEAKLLAGKSGYDVVVPSTNFLSRQIKAGLFRKLDRSKLPNLGNMDPAIMARTASFDPGNAHALNYMWGTTGIGYVEDKIKARLADAPVGSWDMIFKPEIAAKFKDCGIAVLDAPDDMIGIALNYLKLGPNSEKPEDIAKAEALLAKARPFVRYFHASQYITDLANADVCLAVGYSGDVVQAQKRASEAKKAHTIAFSIPAEGTQMWFDMLAIPADAPHADAAHAFINFVLDAQISAAISNEVAYASGNAAALPFVSAEIKSDPNIYPPEAVRAKLYTLTERTPAAQRLMTRAWTRIKTGK